MMSARNQKHLTLNTSDHYIQNSGSLDSFSPLSCRKDRNFEITEYYPLAHFARFLGLRGHKPFRLFEFPHGPSFSNTFRQRVASARSSHGAFGACLHLYKAHEYAQMRLVTDESGLAGFALAGQEIVSLFCNRERPGGRALPTLIALALQLGGVHLTCFATTLEAMYKRSGFQETRRVPWDDALARDDWDYEALAEFSGGRPDVVSMVGIHRTHAFEVIRR